MGDGCIEQQSMTVHLANELPPFNHPAVALSVNLGPLRLRTGIVEFYVRDCCNHAAETREIVRGVHRQKEAVVRQCRLMSGLQLTRIDKNVVYDDREFAKQQADHCVDVRKKASTTG